jgi:hypothetical protein
VQVVAACCSASRVSSHSNWTSSTILPPSRIWARCSSSIRHLELEGIIDLEVASEVDLGEYVPDMWECDGPVAVRLDSLHLPFRFRDRQSRARRQRRAVGAEFLKRARIQSSYCESLYEDCCVRTETKFCPSIQSNFLSSDNAQFLSNP